MSTSIILAFVCVVWPIAVYKALDFCSQSHIPGFAYPVVIVTGFLTNTGLWCSLLYLLFSTR